jgi:hypothetical protein
MWKSRDRMYDKKMNEWENEWKKERKKSITNVWQSILLLAFYLFIVYPQIGDFTNLAGYPPLQPNIIFCDYLLDHNLSLSMYH